ncbi:Enoyl-CoA hydratase/isomerase [Candidatus Terasakiella magnetica]|uniref:Enoyl-CoA hydratase/isomerase n=1 Tax=Candidatus Terasakiella magnetica TaxID=1867952 RepID=A0A1C3RGN2_9PROT|nr:enoyl-CoA hydratase [Candidatus Terasakiella magnetica]SCA56425.1 Enoyl-CoA hydratase/isomerase [Candidatus Terasakiella magnetica]
MTQDILIETHGPVRVIKFNRAEKKNAITLAMYEALSDALVEADQAADIRACILATANENFTTGNDLQDFLAHPELDEKAGPARFITQISQMKKPLIAAVEGLCVGVGATLLLHCDFIYASEQASLSFPFVNIALVPEAGSTLLLERLIGHQKASELLMLGESFEARLALELGLINELVSKDKALAHALETAQKLAQKPPTALLATKALMKSKTRDLEGRMAEEFIAFASCLKSPELQEAIQAFMEKRAPDYSDF